MCESLELLDVNKRCVSHEDVSVQKAMHLIIPKWQKKITGFVQVFFFLLVNQCISVSAAL